MPSSPLSPHSPATTADRQPAAAEYPSLSNNQVSSHGSRKGVVHHRASSPLHQLPVLHRPQVAPIKRSSLYCTVRGQATAAVSPQPRFAQDQQYRRTPGTNNTRGRQRANGRKHRGTKTKNRSGDTKEKSRVNTGD